jgi:CRP-like cAMP-binding protein
MVTGATVETAVRRTTTAIALFKKHAAPSAATLSLAQLQALMVELAATRESRMQDVPGYLAEHPPKALPVGFDELVRVYNSYVDWIIVKETAALPAAPAPAKPAPATSDASNPSAALAAIGEGDADALEELLGAGLSANVTLDGGSSLLLAATEAGSTDCVEVLIKAGAAVGFARAADGCTALHAAAMASQMEVVELLLGHGANVHAKSSAGKTAAELATHADITSLLGEASESMPADMPSTDGADAKLLGADAAQSLKFRVNSGGHRRGSVSAERVDPLSAGGKKKVVDKSDADKARIETSLMKSFLFKHADAGQRADLVNAMYEVRKPKGADVIKQGDREANEFFLIDSGECDIYKRFGDDPVEKKLVTFGVGAAFGELALMYNTPRAASVRVASDEVVLWAMDRDSFKTIVLFNTMEKRCARARSRGRPARTAASAAASAHSQQHDSRRADRQTTALRAHEPASGRLRAYVHARATRTSLLDD